MFVDGSLVFGTSCRETRKLQEMSWVTDASEHERLVRSGRFQNKHVRECESRLNSLKYVMTALNAYSKVVSITHIQYRAANIYIYIYTVRVK